MKTFKCKFGKGVACEVNVTDEFPTDGSQHIQKVKWSGKLRPGLLRPYISWMNSVNKLLADEWNVKLMHVFMKKPYWEIWVYEPNKEPKNVTYLK